MTQGKLLEFLENIDLLEHFQLPTKWQNPLQVLPQETVLSEAEFSTSRGDKRTKVLGV